MADNAFVIDVDSKDYARFYAATRKIEPEITKALRKRLTAVTKPITNEVKQAALSLPSKRGATEKGSRGEIGLGLRQGIAAAVEQKIKPSGKSGLNIRIRVSGTTFFEKTGKPRKLPRYVEGLSKKPWRHPVYADAGAVNGTWTGAWVEQKSTPFLVKTVIPHKQEFKDAVYDSFVEALHASQIINAEKL
jgi:intein/homing endonuclease